MAIYGEVNLQMIPVGRTRSSENEYNNLAIGRSTEKPRPNQGHGSFHHWID